MVGVRHVLARELRDGVRPARLADRADRRDLPLLDVRNACVPKTSLVEKSTKRSSVVERRERGLERVVGADHVHAHRPHRALEHGVDAGDRRAVDEVRRAARGSRERVRVEDVALDAARSSGGRRARCPASASRWRLSNATTVFRSTSSRASVVPMKPAPPVMKIRLPSSIAQKPTSSDYARAGSATAAATSVGAQRDRRRRAPRRRSSPPAICVQTAAFPRAAVQRTDDEPPERTARARSPSITAVITFARSATRRPRREHPHRSARSPAGRRARRRTTAAQTTGHEIGATSDPERQRRGDDPDAREPQRREAVEQLHREHASRRSRRCRTRVKIQPATCGSRS